MLGLLHHLRPKCQIAIRPRCCVAAHSSSSEGSSRSSGVSLGQGGCEHGAALQQEPGAGKRTAMVLSVLPCEPVRQHSHKNAHAHIASARMKRIGSTQPLCLPQERPNNQIVSATAQDQAWPHPPARPHLFPRSVSLRCSVMAGMTLAGLAPVTKPT